MPDAPASPAAALQITLLGQFRVLAGGEAIPDAAWKLRKARALLKLLALAPGGRVPRDEVLDLLWPDRDPAAADNNLRGALLIARRALAPAG
jgi:DNA-binding SARP family transcriptional activator